MSITAGTTALAGPTGSSAWRWWARMARDPLGTYAALGRTYGDAVKVPLNLPMGKEVSVYLLTRPEHAQHVLLAGQDNYRRPFTYRPTRAFLGDGLLTAEGEIWQRHRKLLAPAFARRSVRGLAPGIGASIDDAAARWMEPGSIDLAAEMRSLTLTIAGRALFGVDLSEDSAAVSRALSTLQSAIIPAAMLPTGRSPRTTRRILDLVPAVRAASGTLDDVVDKIVREHAQADGPGLEGGVLSALLSADPPLDPVRLRDEIRTLMLAGHETTAGALTWTFVLLSRFPDVRRQLEEEADERGPDTVAPGPFASAVLQESMRLYPPAWTIERRAIHDDDVAGVRIPGGSTVAVPPYLIHRNPEVWPNPEGFDPTRFLDGSGDDRPPFSFIPFGGGKRICIGSDFAMLEATMVLSRLARTHRFDLAVGGAPPPRVGVTMFPAGPVNATVRMR